MQVIGARIACAAARHADDGRLAVRTLQDDGHLLVGIAAVQVVVEDAGLPLHGILVEDTVICDGLGAVREEQRSTLILRLHGPHLHDMRLQHILARILRDVLPQDLRHLLLDADGRVLLLGGLCLLALVFLFTCIGFIGLSSVHRRLSRLLHGSRSRRGLLMAGQRIL